MNETQVDQLISSFKELMNKPNSDKECKEIYYKIKTVTDLWETKQRRANRSLENVSILGDK